jgi:DNA-methyltransferase (dcm)
MYRTIDLCAGIGGIRRGFELTGHFVNVLSAEVDEYAARTYEHLFGDDPRNDLTSDEFKEKVSHCKYDVLMAGFPCQPFSSQGNLDGFSDLTKGTIFFHIAQIVELSRPKAIFLENVQNIVSHDKKRTIKVIIDTIEKKLNYKVIGVVQEDDGELVYDKKSFVRNTKNFGLPQNRPRAYFIAFNRDLYGARLDSEGFVNELPSQLSQRLLDHPYLNKNLNEILEASVDLKYYLSATYLDTLEKHARRQKEHGNGFGYYVLNNREHNREYANTIMATGGSGKERNLVIQKMPVHTYEEEKTLKKKGGINKKNIRMMTPTEWGRLQGFIGYGFVDPITGAEGFSFPENIPEGQKYKQFGNSVSIPVIETMAEFIYDQLVYLTDSSEKPVEK